MIKFEIKLHPWLNDGWVIASIDDKRITSQFFVTGEVIRGTPPTTYDRIHHIWQCFPGVIEEAEKHVREVVKLLVGEGVQ